MDGLTVLRRAAGGGYRVPLIVMTAHGDSATVIEAMRLGAYDYVAKPLDFDQRRGATGAGRGASARCRRKRCRKVGQWA